jgi:hypothetical protein
MLQYELHSEQLCCPSVTYCNCALAISVAVHVRIFAGAMHDTPEVQLQARLCAVKCMFMHNAVLPHVPAAAVAMFEEQWSSRFTPGELGHIQDVKAFPMVAAPDLDLLSFVNGVYVLPENRFIGNEDPEAANITTSRRIARHHTDKDFTGSTATPKFDMLVTYQVEDPAAYEWLLAMLGRMLYRVGQLDNWQVMLYMYGLAGAGKSTVYKIWQHAFRKDAVEFLNGNTEDKFGLEKLRSTKAEVIMCMDVPSDKPTSSVLSQDLWQLAVEGGTVNVPGKGQLARSHTLRLPIAMAGNKFLDYRDSNGNVTRRVVAVRYQRYLPADQQDGDLEKTIVAEELPALIKRCNELYLQRACENGSKGIWHLLPEYYSAIRHNAAETVNPLRQFLHAPCPELHHSETRHFALYEEAATTPQPQLVLAMQTFMRLTHPGVRAPSKWSGDEVQPLNEEGYERKTVAICKACRQPHKTGCCEHYGSKNKTTTQLWLNLKLVAVEPAGRNHVDDWY